MERDDWACSSGIEAVADASELEGELELFVSIGVWSRVDTIGAPSSSHERVVQILC